ncbi:hypothetical protein [Microbacterium candidum]|uniref:DUF2567 domain-containing protein n=1 Tax=Microbacterium candidum TaxID=3041922 RepID=A0ABT7MV20_9MICO|nr:hypothetical protein [Microbacterium sp. ASV49]MDL9978293.1 hypothetical protein [Microbacterium sp. ASV49]
MYVPWEFLALWVGVPVVIAGAVIVLAARSRRGASRTGLSRADMIGIAITGTGAFLVAGLSAAAVVGTAFLTFSSEPTRIPRMPVSSDRTPAFADKSDAIVGAGYETAWLEVAGLPIGPRWMLFLEGALPLVASCAIGGAIFWLSIALRRRKPFTRLLPLGIGIAAVAVMIGGMGAQLAGAYGRAMVVNFLGAAEVTAGGDGTSTYESLAGFALNLDAAPIGWAFGLALVAMAFQMGTRLQKDTEGLV